MPLDVLIPLALGLTTLALVFGHTSNDENPTTRELARNTTELAAVTAPGNLDMQVRQWLRDNPAPDMPGIPENIRQLQAQVFADYMTTIAHPQPDPQALAIRHGNTNLQPYIATHAEALQHAKIAAALDNQAAANAALSEALRKRTA